MVEGATEGEFGGAGAARARALAAPVLALGRRVGPEWQAALLLAAWSAAVGLRLDIAFSRTTLRMAADVVSWGPRGSAILPGLLALAALGGGVALARLRGAGPLPLRLGALRLLIAGLLLLLGASLWDPLGALFPFLSLLWAHEAGWALFITVLALLLPQLARTRLAARLSRALPTRRLAAAVFLGAAVVYAVCGLYLCQLTMLHGDEAHYLIVAQSLLRDGDVDLSNNLADGDILEFRDLPFEVHRAPSSPPGTVYSVHPPGVSLLLAPPYALGLALWHHPRIACSLLMAVLTALWLSLAFVWLTRVGGSRWIALVTTSFAATTIPLLTISNQLYSEVPALVLATAVLALLAHWQVDLGRYRALGAGEPWRLAALTLGLGLLPFLHPRYAPLGAVLGLGLLLQAASSPDRRRALAGVGIPAAACLLALVAWNVHVSGDWLGHLRPGNAWDANALQPAMWRLSLPGQWLYGAEGLAANAPVYLLVFAGVGHLAVRRCRLLPIAAVLYLTTAMVNGLHPDWTFGFGPPARFMVSAMPALVLLLNASLKPLLRWAPGAFVVGYLAAASWDAAIPALQLPAMTYDGQHLVLRALTSFYPIDAHFLPSDTAAGALADLAFWGVVLAAAAAIGAWHASRRTAVLAAAIAATAIAPVVWGRTETAARKLAAATSPYVSAMSDEDANLRGIATVYAHSLQRAEVYSTGRDDDEGYRRARRGQDGPGQLATYYLPLQRPGVFRITTTQYGLTASDGTPECAILSARPTLPVVQRWETRRYLPLPAGRDLSLSYVCDDWALGYLRFLYSGRSDMEVGRLDAAFSAVDLRTDERVVARHEVAASTPTLRASTTDLLEPGRYRVRFALSGNALTTLFERRTASVLMAMCAGAPDQAEALQRASEPWFFEDRDMDSVFANPGLVHPEVERLQAPWWVHVPGASDAYDLTFSVGRPRLVRVMVRYEGPADLRVDEIVVRKQELAP